MVPRLRNSPPMYSYARYSAGALFDALLAGLPAILDSFFIITTSDYIGVICWGWWGAMKWQGKHTLYSYTCFMDPLVLELACNENFGSPSKIGPPGLILAAKSGPPLPISVPL